MDIKKAPRRRPANRRGIKEILEAERKNHAQSKGNGWNSQAQYKQKQEGQYDTMEKSPASTMKLLSWCGIGSGCRGPSVKKGLTNVYILLNTFEYIARWYRRGAASVYPPLLVTQIFPYNNPVMIGRSRLRRLGSTIKSNK